jgi:Ca-activated chloride channel family protein
MLQTRLALLILTPILAVAGAAGQAFPDYGETLRVDLDLVLVPATVLDTGGRVVDSLSPRSFRLWEDRIEQEIRQVSSESVPTSIGVVLDTSDSMNADLARTRNAIGVFLDSGHAEDEYFLIEFNDQPELRSDFTGDVAFLRREATDTIPEGRTALYDAIYRAISKLEQGNHARKALLIVTDGEDNHSRYSRRNLENYVRESGVQIYALGVASSFGKGVLRDLSELTGGRAAFADGDDDLEAIARELSREMTSQYVLSYVSTNQEHAGEWREIRVRVEPEGDSAPFTVRARRGYYARTW